MTAPGSAPGSTPAAARPTGVTILAILAGVEGILAAVTGIAYFVIGTVIFGAAGSLLGLALIAVAALFIAFCYGALTGQPWTWPLGVVAAAAGIIVNLLYIVGGGTPLGPIITIVICAAILYYLNLPAIKAHFGRA
jgi:hypothetical protein